MKNSSQIADLHSPKTRNLLRGVIGNSSGRQIIENLKKIRELSEEDFRRALEVMRTSTIFKGSPIGGEFNKTFHKVLEPGSTYQLDEIVSKFSQYEKKIIDLLVCAHKVIGAIARYELGEGIKYCSELINKEGASIFVLRILYFIRNHAGDQSVVTSEIDHMLNELNTDNLHYLSLAIRELSSNKTDYFNICEKINNSDPSLLISVAKSFVDIVPRTEQQFLTTLNSYYSISVFDAFLYYCNVLRLGLPFCQPKLASSLSYNFQLLSDVAIDFNLFYDSSHDAVGHEYFREAFLLVETDQAFRCRVIYGATFTSVANSQVYRVPFERTLLHQFYSNLNKLSEIGAAQGRYEIFVNSYVSNTACLFANSNALAYLLELKDGDIEAEENEFVRLMSLTRDIGTICSSQHIQSIKNRAQSDELNLVATCLSYIKEKSQLKEHELRSVIQQIVIRRFDLSLTALLSYLYDISPAVTEHLIQTSDETFLSKLFITIKTPNKAIEERANMLEWYGTKTADTTFLERAKNLRIDIQINKEKGTIDDSRIYVDPVRFTQWINDQVLNQITILLDVIPPASETGVVALNWDKVKTGLTVYDQLGSILLRCYEEFCSNKIYGIASYLGRRIRHGTLKGTGLTDVKSFKSDPANAKLFSNSDFDAAFGSWLREYEQILDQLRDRYLHINDKTKADGMISKDFRTINKKLIGNYLVNDIVRSFEVNKNGLELPYIITEYCWRLIEEDLNGIRKFLMEKKARYAVFRPDSLNDQRRQREIQEFCRELNSITAEKFRVISSWFNKPSIASPSADIALLFKAVVSEIKGFFSDYSPTVIVGDNEFVISGGLYFVIYDALYILIYNAAKYGKPDGVLALDVATRKLDDQSSINIMISSEIALNDTIAKVADSIQSALDGDCEDALIIEGRSGIKKLRRLEQGNYIDRVQYGFGESTVHASFDFKFNY